MVNSVIIAENRCAVYRRRGSSTELGVHSATFTGGPLGHVLRQSTGFVRFPYRDIVLTPHISSVERESRRGAEREGDTESEAAL